MAKAWEGIRSKERCHEILAHLGADLSADDLAGRVARRTGTGIELEPLPTGMVEAGMTGMTVTCRKTWIFYHPDAPAWFRGAVVARGLAAVLLDHAAGRPRSDGSVFSLYSQDPEAEYLGALLVAASERPSGTIPSSREAIAQEVAHLRSLWRRLVTGVGVNVSLWPDATFDQEARPGVAHDLDRIRLMVEIFDAWRLASTWGVPEQDARAVDRLTEHGLPDAEMATAMELVRLELALRRCERGRREIGMSDQGRTPPLWGATIADAAGRLREWLLRAEQLMVRDAVRQAVDHVMPRAVGAASGATSLAGRGG